MEESKRTDYTDCGFSIIHEEGRWWIVDCEGRALERALATNIVELLAVQYPPIQYLYVGIDRLKGIHKVGISADPEVRCEKQLGIELLTCIICLHPIYTARQLEMYVHQQLKQRGRHVEGEWFKLDPTELIVFNSCETDDELLTAIKNDWIVSKRRSD